MKTILFSLLLLGLTSTQAFGQAGIIKQRARQLSDQNNARQGIAPRQPATPGRPAAPGAQPTAPGQPAAPALPTVASPEVLRRYDINNLKTDLTAMKFGAQVTSGQIDQMTKDLTTASRASARPGAKAISQLAGDLSKALPQADLPASNRAQLAEDLVTILNCANVPASQTRSIISRLQADFEIRGVPRREAAAVADDLNAIVGEVGKASGR